MLMLWDLFMHSALWPVCGLLASHLRFFYCTTVVVSCVTSACVCMRRYSLSSGIGQEPSSPMA